MKKIIFFLLINLLFVPNVLASTIVMDADSKRVLYEDNIHEKKLIASTSKILTAIIVLENANLNDYVTVSYDVLKATGSNIYIEIGEKMKVEDLLYGLLLRSGNDAAIMLAEHVSKTEDEFAKLMNDYKNKIGMKDSNFINSSGLEDEKGNGNTSTAYDMALLAAYAFKNKEFLKIVGTRERAVKTNYKSYHWTNKNKLLFDYKYCLGGKTGYTKKAKRTLVTFGEKDGKRLIVVTLNEKNDFETHKKLYENMFKKYDLVTVVDKNFFMPTDDTYVLNSISMLLSEKEKNKVDIKIKRVDDVSKRYGYIEVSLDNKIYFKENIYIKEKKSLLDKIKNFFKRWF